MKKLTKYFFLAVMVLTAIPMTTFAGGEDRDHGHNRRGGHHRDHGDRRGGRFWNIGNDCNRWDRDYYGCGWEGIGCGIGNYGCGGCGYGYGYGYGIGCGTGCGIGSCGNYGDCGNYGYGIGNYGYGSNYMDEYYRVTDVLGADYGYAY